MMGVVFSRDRALQLDAALRSFWSHCADPGTIRLVVIYRATSDQHRHQYLRLAKEHAVRGSIIFLNQKKFRKDVLTLLKGGTTSAPAGACRRWLQTFAARMRFPGRLAPAHDPSPYVLFLVDDCIFVRSFHLGDLCEALNSHPEALGFSLRLGHNVTYCYPHDAPQPTPRFAHLPRRMLKFDWTVAEMDFGYPLELSASVYRIHDIVGLLSGIRFTDPNTLEAAMAVRAKSFSPKSSCLLCYEQSVTFCNPINKVQTQTPNRAGVKPEYASERLAQLFDEGYRVQVKAYAGFTPHACHQETELVLTKREGISVGNAGDVLGKESL